MRGIDDPNKLWLVARLLAAQRSDEVAGWALRDLKNHPKPAALALLRTLRDRYKSQAWGRELLPLLDSADQELQEAAVQFLSKSSDPEAWPVQVSARLVSLRLPRRLALSLEELRRFLEPVFAAIWSAIADGERLSASGYAGSAMILAAMFLGGYVTVHCQLPARGCRL